MDAKQVPLRELLASVPADARLVIDDADGKGTRSIPVGRLCQEAAAALAEPVQEPKPVAYIDALKDAFFEGFTSVATYNDMLLNSPEEAWEKYKPPRITPPQRPAEPQGCDHCKHPLYAAIKCRVCGRVTEPVQEPDSPERRCGGPGCDMRCCQPVEENKDA